MKILIVFISLIVFILSVSGQTQQVMTTAGGNGQGTNTQIEWTLGETIVTTFSTADTILTQGFHQPLLTVTAINTYDSPDIRIQVYPNPAQDQLMIQLGCVEIKDFRYVLYDMNGKFLRQQILLSDITNINMDNYLPGIYLLKILKKDIEIQVFEIMKR